VVFFASSLFARSVSRFHLSLSLFVCFSLLLFSCPSLVAIILCFSQLQEISCGRSSPGIFSKKLRFFSLLEFSLVGRSQRQQQGTWLVWSFVGMSFSLYGSMSILCFSIFRELWSVISRRICLMSSSVEMHAKRALRSSFLLASTVCSS